MTVLYSNDFESLTHLATIPAFTSTGGSNFIVLGPPFSPAPPARGSYRYGAADNADQNYWNGNTTLTNCAVRHATIVLSGAYIAHLLRYNTTTGACYRAYYEWDGTNLRGTIAKWDGSSTLNTQQSGYTIPYTNGDVLHMESRAVGTTIELRLWTNSNARPSAALVSLTDSEYTTGAVGLRRVFGSSTYANVDDLVITDSTGGEDFFYPSSSAATAVTLTAPSPASGYAGVASGNFSVGANGTISGTVNVTPSDGGAGGSFTPTSVAISSGTPTATFTYTPASAGAKTISVANDGGLSSPTSVTYTATSVPTITLGITNNTNQPLLSQTLPNVTLQDLLTRSQVFSQANMVTDGTTGDLVIASTALTSGTSYMLTCWNADGTLALIEKVTAS